VNGVARDHVQDGAIEVVRVLQSLPAGLHVIKEVLRLEKRKEGQKRRIEKGGRWIGRL
jgi:hypothetical protein